MWCFYLLLGLSLALRRLMYAYWWCQDQGAFKDYRFCWYNDKVNTISCLGSIQRLLRSHHRCKGDSDSMTRWHWNITAISPDLSFNPTKTTFTGHFNKLYDVYVIYEVRWYQRSKGHGDITASWYPKMTVWIIRYPRYARVTYPLWFSPQGGATRHHSFILTIYLMHIMFITNSRGAKSCRHHDADGKL